MGAASAGWRERFEKLASERPLAVEARTFHRVFWSFSQPAHVACNDGFDYVVKGLHNDLPDEVMGRAMVADHVVGLLGAAMAASVGEVALVRVPADLIALNPEFQHFKPGIAHGCRWIGHTTDRLWDEYMREEANRERFARLAILYGWMHANDEQVIYDRRLPHLVHSVDHGHFLPGETLWNQASLEGDDPPTPNQQIVQGANLTRADLRDAARQLLTVSDDDIARAIAAPPSEWGITIEEREALAVYAIQRRDALIASTAT